MLRESSGPEEMEILSAALVEQGPALRNQDYCTMPPICSLSDTTDKSYAYALDFSHSLFHRFFFTFCVFPPLFYYLNTLLNESTFKTDLFLARIFSPCFGFQTTRR